MLTRALTVDSKAVQRHRATILECVKDSDASIQRRALELIYLLVNVNNVKPLAKELIEYLEVREQDFKGVLTAKICSIERSKLFAPEKIWYIDQMLKVLSEAGNYVKDDVWHALIVVITNAPDLHGRTNYGEYHHPAVFVVTCDWYCRWKLCVPHILKNVFQIWKTSETTYIRLPGSRMDFLEVVWTSWKSSGLHGSLLTKSPFHNRSECFGKFLCLIFLHLVFNQMVLMFYSFKGRSINFIYVFFHLNVFGYGGFSDLEDFSDDLPVSRLKYNALDDFQEVFQTTSISVVWTSWKSYGLPGSRLDFLEVVWTSWKSNKNVGSFILIQHFKKHFNHSSNS
ncbi:hypothetical protein IGI04_002213 [Brassica rapa subsp. trilocularis]|uniref:Clathrin/coatomer adaptor adaptin-like N-terminal domain-containing protein n=1 Tax=Brassica rapa subsp. trilocularis TaxID=1813537 RepID=A0ABQ7NUV9_BRACM|nr:hypothetical protein IGI04_002213 [Brassica rapa subsp. trilocularis]